VGHLITRFTSEFFVINKPIGRENETPILVLGMPRWGTTLTERIISSHSRVGGGELDFWNGLLDVDYEELTAGSEGTATRLIAFCGFDWEAACLLPERNRDRVKTASMWQARQAIYRRSVERWRRYQPWLGGLLLLSPQET
jgi:hypothetical protein